MTISDLFNGKQRIWFVLENTGTADVDLRYDTPIAAVLITEEGQTTDLYYNFISEDGNDDLNLAVSEYPNPFSCPRFTVQDFDNLSDDEIIDLVSQSYANAKKNIFF